jgi:hypothetical protein
MWTMRKLVFGLLLMLAAAPVHATAGEFPYGDRIIFNAYRNGEMIGQHAVAFRHEGNQLFVTTSVDFAVKMVGLTVYRYTLRSQEKWSGNTFQNLISKADDDGKKFYLGVQHEGDALIVDHDEAGKQRDSLPGSVIPASHWNILQTSQHALLNAQTGKLEKVQVTPLGRETIKTSSGQIEADHFRYEGDISMDQWFDSKGRWVKMTFKVKSDGSVVDYVLQN